MLVSWIIGEYTDVSVVVYYVVDAYEDPAAKPLQVLVKYPEPLYDQGCMLTPRSTFAASATVEQQLVQQEHRHRHIVYGQGLGVVVELVGLRLVVFSKAKTITGAVVTEKLESLPYYYVQQLTAQ